MRRLFVRCWDTASDELPGGGGGGGMRRGGGAGDPPRAAVIDRNGGFV